MLAWSIYYEQDILIHPQIILYNKTDNNYPATNFGIAFSFPLFSLVFLLVSTEEHLIGLIDQAIYSILLIFSFHCVAGNAIFTYLINAGFLLVY